MKLSLVNEVKPCLNANRECPNRFQTFPFLYAALTNAANQSIDEEGAPTQESNSAAFLKPWNFSASISLRYYDRRDGVSPIRKARDLYKPNQVYPSFPRFAATLGTHARVSCEGAIYLKARCLIPCPPSVAGNELVPCFIPCRKAYAVAR